jgi:two-component system response regulator HydG
MATLVQKRVLIADDEPTILNALRQLVSAWGYEVATAKDGQLALEAVQTFKPHILLLDLTMPRKNGLTLLKELRDRNLQVPTLVVSGAGDISNAVQAVKLGAYDYLEKPVDPPHLRLLLSNLSEHLTVSEENERLLRRLRGAGELGSMIGRSLAIREVMTQIEQVAPSAASVIICGESGTGKELVARTLHYLSERRTGPYLAMNCAAIPASLFESELFGHERGAFTGADVRRQGCFELANGGTLLLDEITEMKVELQPKLLRAIEERKVRRVGGTAEISLDVRILAASNRNLDQAVLDGKLREDLYYRLNVFRIDLPPLRTRIDDIPLLVEHFIGEFSQQRSKPVLGVDHECMEILQSYHWPGNIRQLRNVVERASIVSPGPLLTSADLPPEFRKKSIDRLAVEVPLGSSLEQAERWLIVRTLEFVGGNKVRAAEILGISTKTLYNRLEQYELKDRADSA